MIVKQSNPRKKYISKMFGLQVLKTDPKLLKLKKTVGPIYYQDYDKLTRDDIKKLVLSKTNSIYIGSSNKKDILLFKNKILPILKIMFKNDTKKMMAYIELSSKDKLLNLSYKKDKTTGNALNSCYETTGGNKYAIIDINKKTNSRLNAISHELIHASRCVNNDNIINIHKDEAETALENVARLPIKYLKEKLKPTSRTGYYGYIEGESDILHDKDIIQSKCKDKDLRKCIKKNIKYTKIGKWSDKQTKGGKHA